MNLATSLLSRITQTLGQCSRLRFLDGYTFTPSFAPSLMVIPRIATLRLSKT